MSPRPQSFDAVEAERYGVEGAVMLNHFRYWLNNHVAADRNIHDGEVWNHIAVKKLAEIYPYWSVAQVRRILDALVQKGALKSGNYNQHGYDRTLWYTIPGHLAECDPGSIHLLKRANHDAGTNEPIPRSYQDPNQEPTPPLIPHERDERTPASSLNAESALEEEFKRWWDIYPVKKGKAAARRKYTTARRMATSEALRAGAQRALLDYQRRTPADRRFVKHPSTWLHQGCWEDEEAAAPLTPDSPAWMHFEGHPEPEQGDWRWEPYGSIADWQKDVLRREAHEAREMEAAK